MAVEIKILAYGAVLLMVHIMAAIMVKTAQYGAKWNMGARDDATAPPSQLAGRLDRAQANFQETFPFAIAALLGVVVAGKTSPETALGGWMWLGARVAYLPIYALGIPYLRTAVFIVSVIGLFKIAGPLLS